MPEPSDLEIAAQELATSMDAKELAERTQAADAYSTEDPTHFVEYGKECKEESSRTTIEIREDWFSFWEAYNLQRRDSTKEDWQANVITPTPFTIVQQAKSVVRQALVDRPDYMTIEGTPGHDAALAELYKLALKFFLDDNHANFPLAFANASEMAFALGQSMEIIPVWVRNANDTDSLQLVLRPCWHIFRDPSAVPGDPWSGMYWIHSEWMDKWELLQMQANGVYQGIEDAFTGDNSTDRSQEKDTYRKQYILSRNKFRESIEANEFWGVVLDKSGNLLLPNARYAWAGNSLIRKVGPNPFPTIRWPGVSFPAVPHALRYEGRSLLAGVLSLWRLSDNVLNAHSDDLNWTVNRMFEIESGMLEDEGEDSELYPGKTFWKKTSAAPGAAVREVMLNPSRTGEILPNLQFLRGLIENGSFVNEFVAGLPGDRSKITKGEVEIKTQQSMGIFDSIGKDIEYGAVNALRAIIDVMAVCWTDFSNPGIKEVLGDKYAAFASSLQLAMPEQRIAQMKLNASIKVSGISALLRQNDMLQRLEGLMRLVGTTPMFAQFIKPYNLLKAQVTTLGLADEDIIKTEQEIMDEQAQNAAAGSGGIVNQSLAKAGLKPAQPAGGPQGPAAPIPVATPGMIPKGGTNATRPRRQVPIPQGNA